MGREYYVCTVELQRFSSVRTAIRLKPIGSKFNESKPVLPWYTA